MGTFRVPDEAGDLQDQCYIRIEALVDTGASYLSLFVNPTQFGLSENLAAYPRDFQRAQALLET